jgi:hypothetical protein
MTSQHEQHLKEIAIAKLVALGLTEAELRALGLRSDDNN